MGRARTAYGLVAGADDIRSRVQLARYFARSGVRRTLARASAVDRRVLRFSLGGVTWEVTTESSQLGGIHDVWLGAEYDAFPGFRAEPGMVVLDVGANVGAYALWQRRNTGGRGRVVAIEASPSTFAALQNNVALNQADDVVCLQRAVWRESGDIEFLASERQSSTAGIAETADLGLLEAPESVRVPAITLAEAIDLADPVGQIDIVKLDVEGAEVEIIQAAPSATLARIRRMVIESDDAHHGELRTLAERAGFEFVGRNRSVSYFSAGS